MKPDGLGVQVGDLFCSGYKPMITDRYKSVNCLFTFLMVLFDEEKKLSLMEPKFFCLYWELFVFCWKKRLLYIQGHCSSSLSVTVTSSMNTVVWEWKGFIWPARYSLSLREAELGTQGRSLK